MFVGLLDEYNILQKEVPNLEFYDCKDFLEMAEIIKASKFFIGNLCFAYSVAEDFYGDEKKLETPFSRDAMLELHGSTEEAR